MLQGLSLRPLARTSGFIKIPLLLLACGLAAARATPLYGVVSSGSAGDASSGQKWNTGGYLSVATYASPVLNYTDSYQVSEPNLVTVSDGATAWFSEDGTGGLHGYASANGSESGATSGTVGGAAASFSGFWTDTLFVVGLPAGTPVQIQLTNVLNSFASYSGGASASVSITESASLSGTRSISSMFSNYDGQTYTPTNGMQTQTLILQTFAGDTLQLTVQLVGSAQNGGETTGALSTFATADVSDTADTVVTVLTPGASYTSASGITYDASIPEPASLCLAAAGLLVIWAARRLTKRRSCF